MNKCILIVMLFFGAVMYSQSNGQESSSSGIHLSQDKGYCAGYDRQLSRARQQLDKSKQQLEAQRRQVAEIKRDPAKFNASAEYLKQAEDDLNRTETLLKSSEI